MIDDVEIPAALRAWAKEIRKDPSRYATGAEDAKLLDRAADLIERALKARQRS
jgi:hypothetical protein